MNDRYILRNGRPVLEPDVIRWARWFESAPHERIVAQTELGDGSITVSTVFLGLDHRMSGRGRPVLWETMVFNFRGVLDQQCERYTSREDAERGHATMVSAVRGALTALWIAEHGSVEHPP
jgi:hypothetical protein